MIFVIAAKYVSVASHKNKHKNHLYLFTSSQMTRKLFFYYWQIISFRTVRFWIQIGSFWDVTMTPDLAEKSFCGRLYSCIVLHERLVKTRMIFFSTGVTWSELDASETREQTVPGASDFAVCCTVVGNSLPTDLRVLSVTATTLAKHLKPYLFSRPV